MKNIGLYSFLILGLALVGCTRSQNPVLEGWYADPEAIIYDDSYWIYPTWSDIYSRQTFFDAFSSSDLVTWTKHSGILDTSSIKWARYAMWAPSVIDANDRYYLFFGANDIQDNMQMGGIGVAVSDDPAGPFTDALGKPLIGSFENGAQPIDQFVYRDTDGSFYMYYGGWGHCNVVMLEDDLLSLRQFENGEYYREVTPDNYVEGPFMFRRQGKYYFMWSEGGWGGPDYRVAYAMGDSPLGPFNRIGVILQQDTLVATGAGHHSVINIPGSDDYYIVYHRRPLDTDERNHRVVCIDRMMFDNEGYILPVKITNRGVRKHRLK